MRQAAEAKVAAQVAAQEARLAEAQAARVEADAEEQARVLASFAPPPSPGLRGGVGPSPWLPMPSADEDEEGEEANVEEEELDATLREEVEAFDISLDGPIDGDEAADDSDLGLELYEDDYLEVDAVEERPSTASVGWRIVGEAS